MKMVRYAWLLMLTLISFTPVRAMDGSSSELLTRFLAQNQQPANYVDQNLYSFLASLIDQEKADAKRERTRAAATKQELKNRIAEFHGAQKWLRFWKFSGLLFFGTTVPAACYLTYEWLRKNNYFGLLGKTECEPEQIPSTEEEPAAA